MSTYLTFPKSEPLSAIFGIEFHHNGHTYVQAISTYKFACCFNLVYNIQYRMSHKRYKFGLDAAMPGRTSAWLFEHVHSHLVYLRDTNSKIFLPNKLQLLSVCCELPLARSSFTPGDESPYPPPPQTASIPGVPASQGCWSTPARNNDEVVWRHRLTSDCMTMVRHLGIISRNALTQGPRTSTAVAQTMASQRRWSPLPALLTIRRRLDIVCRHSLA